MVEFKVVPYAAVWIFIQVQCEWRKLITIYYTVIIKRLIAISCLR